MKRGISSANNLTLHAACLAATGINFAFRYYSQSSWKRLTLAEARTLTDAGIEIGVVYEDGPTKVSYFTAARGQADAQRAIDFAQAMGQPPGTTIYFAVDYDAKPPHFPAISSYFAALRSRLDPTGYHVGIYGGGTVCQTMKENQGLAAFSWLAESTGWLGSRTYTTWDVKQSVAHVPLCGLDGPHDGDAADYEDNQAQGDFGGFTLQPAAPQLAAAMAFSEAAPPHKSPAKSSKKKRSPAKPKKKAPAVKKPTAPRKTAGTKKAVKKAAPKKSAKKTTTPKKSGKTAASKKQSQLRRR